MEGRELFPSQLDSPDTRDRHLSAFSCKLSPAGPARPGNDQWPPLPCFPAQGPAHSITRLRPSWQEQRELRGRQRPEPQLGQPQGKDGQALSLPTQPEAEPGLRRQQEKQRFSGGAPGRGWGCCTGHSWTGAGRARQEGQQELELPTPPLCLCLYRTSQQLLFLPFALHWLCFGLFPLLPAPGPAGKSKQALRSLWLLHHQRPQGSSAELEAAGPHGTHRLFQNIGCARLLS